MRIGQAGRLILLCCAVSALLPAVPAAAAFNAYMIVTGARQGAIKSEASPAGAPAGAIQLTGVVRESPVAAGMSAGKRQHSPITITKEVDSASPKLFRASDSHELLSQVVIGFQGSGAADAAQRIVLTNATILSVRKAGKTEQITLDYQAIDVTYVKGGKTATDDWSVPN